MNEYMNRQKNKEQLSKMLPPKIRVRLAVDWVRHPAVRGHVPTR